MTPEQQAARWLADVTRWTPVSMSETVLFESEKGELVQYDDALAAIARHLAPGDDLVERANGVSKDLRKGINNLPLITLGGVMHGAPCLEAADTITALLARLSALTAERDEARAHAETAWEEAHAHIAMWGDALREAATLRARLARMEGALRAPWLEDHLTPEQIAALTDGGSE